MRAEETIRDMMTVKERLEVIRDFVVQVSEGTPTESKWWCMQGMVREGLEDAIRHLSR
jgi:hypothetical protein